MGNTKSSYDTFIELLRVKFPSAVKLLELYTEKLNRTPQALDFVEFFSDKKIFIHVTPRPYLPVNWWWTVTWFTFDDDEPMARQAVVSKIDFLDARTAYREAISYAMGVLNSLPGTIVQVKPDCDTDLLASDGAGNEFTPEGSS